MTVRRRAGSPLPARAPWRLWRIRWLWIGGNARGPRQPADGSLPARKPAVALEDTFESANLLKSSLRIDCASSYVSNTPTRRRIAGCMTVLSGLPQCSCVNQSGYGQNFDGCSDQAALNHVPLRVRYMSRLAALGAFSRKSRNALRRWPRSARRRRRYFPPLDGPRPAQNRLPQRHPRRCRLAHDFRADPEASWWLLTTMAFLAWTI